jgi:hypothetical protein
MFVVLCMDGSLSSDIEVYPFNEVAEAERWLRNRHVVRGECDNGFGMEAHDVVESSTHSSGETRFDHFSYHFIRGESIGADGCIWCENEQEEEDARRSSADSELREYR